MYIRRCHRDIERYRRARAQLHHAGAQLASGESTCPLNKLLRTPGDGAHRCHHRRREYIMSFAARRG